jgi:hypothetical protein
MGFNPLPFIVTITVYSPPVATVGDAEIGLYERVFRSSVLPAGRERTDHAEDVVTTRLAVRALLPSYTIRDVFGFVLTKLRALAAQWNDATGVCVPSSPLAFELSLPVEPGQTLVLESATVFSSAYAKRRWLHSLTRVLHAVYSQNLAVALTRIVLHDEPGQGIVAVGFIGARPHFLYTDRTHCFELVDGGTVERFLPASPALLKPCARSPVPRA